MQETSGAYARMSCDLEEVRSFVALFCTVDLLKIYKVSVFT